MKTVYAILYCIIWPFFNLFHPCKAIHRERLPQGGAILCPNHTRMSDPFFVVFALGLGVRPQCLAKAELGRVPVIGWLLGKAGVFYVDRGKADVGAVKRSLKCLKDGDKLIMFPEGTRHADGELSEAKTGAAMFSVRAGVPIVPMYIPARKKWFGRTPVVFGEPFYPKTASKKGTAEEYEAISKELTERIAALEAETR